MIEKIQILKLTLEKKIRIKYRATITIVGKIREKQKLKKRKYEPVLVKRRLNKEKWLPGKRLDFKEMGDHVELGQ